MMLVMTLIGHLPHPLKIQHATLNTHHVYIYLNLWLGSSIILVICECKPSSAPIIHIQPANHVFSIQIRSVANHHLKKFPTCSCWLCAASCSWAKSRIPQLRHVRFISKHVEGNLCGQSGGGWKQYGLWMISMNHQVYGFSPNDWAIHQGLCHVATDHPSLDILRDLMQKWEHSITCSCRRSTE